MSFFARIADIWDALVIKLKGKRLVALGARNVGKTHLRTFLGSGEIPTEYRQTARATKIERRRFLLKDLDLKVKSSYDVPGSDEAYIDWKNECDSADIVLYLFRVDSVLNGDRDVIARITKDLGHVATWIRERVERGRKRPAFFLLGTFCDQDLTFPGIAADTYGAYMDRVLGAPVVSEMVVRAGGFQDVGVVLGSMKDRASTEEFVHQLFVQVLR